MSFTFAVPMNMVQLHKSRHYNKRRHQDKSAIFIIKFMHKYTNGSISDLIILVEHQLNGIHKFVKKYSSISNKKTELNNNK